MLERRYTSITVLTIGIFFIDIERVKSTLYDVVIVIVVMYYLGV